MTSSFGQPRRSAAASWAYRKTSRPAGLRNGMSLNSSVSTWSTTWSVYSGSEFDSSWSPQSTSCSACSSGTPRRRPSIRMGSTLATSATKSNSPRARASSRIPPVRSRIGSS